MRQHSSGSASRRMATGRGRFKSGGRGRKWQLCGASAQCAVSRLGPGPPGLLALHEQHFRVRLPLRAVPQSRAVRCGGQRAHARGQLLTSENIAELQVDAAAASGYCCCSWRSELPSCSHGGFTSWAAAWARETATWRGRHAPSSKGACSGRSAGARGRGGTSDAGIGYADVTDVSYVVCAPPGCAD